MPKISAGLLCYRLTSGRLEVLLAHPGGPFWTRKDEGAWTIPKGVLDPGEDDPLVAAKREFAEELGAPPAPRGEYVPLGEVKQKGGKTVVCWAFEGDLDTSRITSNTYKAEWPPRSGQWRDFPEVDRAEFFSVDVARRKINPAQAGFLDRLEELLRADAAGRSTG